MSGPSPLYRPIMVVGTGSHVGKSVLATGLCRIFTRKKIAVAPFKAQNMALNSGITAQGGEMGRAQITQAQAAGIEPHVDMNPILLKPTSQVGSQVIVDGRVLGNYKGSEYYQLKPKLVRRVTAAFRRLRDKYQLIVLEGAGSCAEMNLKKYDLVNMAMAQRAGAKVILAADIDAGGVFAQVAGTLALLTPSERKLVAGVVINKFRGQAELFADGAAYLEKRTGKPVLGVLPMFSHIQLPQEDGVALERGEMRSGLGGTRVGVVRLSHISNFTDADALAAEETVELRWVEKPHELARLDLLILPGTKNTLKALEDLRRSGLDRAIRDYHRLGGKVLGLCGGYQLLGESIADLKGVEGPPGKDRGLGLLPVATTMIREKTTTRVLARCGQALPFAVPGEVRGYEIHMGRTSPLGVGRPAVRIQTHNRGGRWVPGGEVSRDGRVVGTYLHGFLDNDTLRGALLAWAGGGASSLKDYAAFRDEQYDLLADFMEKHLQLDCLLEEIG